MEQDIIYSLYIDIVKSKMNIKQILKSIQLYSRFEGIEDYEYFVKKYKK